jgi:hypothetical protein
MGFVQFSRFIPEESTYFPGKIPVEKPLFALPGYFCIVLRYKPGEHPLTGDDS